MIALESAQTEQEHRVDTLGEFVEFSVVMPCLNEARTVGRCVLKARGALEAQGIRGEVVVADNGSTDGSQRIARECGARVVHSSQRGYGSALKAGIAAAAGRYVIMGDSDDSYDFSMLEPFIERLRAGDDLVMGNRFRGGILKGAMPPLHRFIGNPLLTGILNLFFRTPIGDAHCGLRGFRKLSYEQLNLASPGMEFASEMVVKARLNGHTISEVPTVLHPDGRDRPPHLRSFRDGWRHLRLLLLLSPDWLYLVPAVLLTLFTAILCVMNGLFPWSWSPSGGVRGAQASLAAVTCVILIYQLFWMWAHAKVQGWRCGIFPTDALSPRLALYLADERVALAGGVLLVAGLCLNCWVRFGVLPPSAGPVGSFVGWPLSLSGVLTIVMGAQTIIGNFQLGAWVLAKERGLPNTTQPPARSEP